MLPVPKFLQKNDHQQQHNSIINHQRPVQQSNKIQIQNYGRKRFKNSDHVAIQYCDFDDCHFRSANIDEMMMHKKINHFQLRFSNEFLMDSPEEILKWRAERRSKYPRLSSSGKTNNNNDNSSSNNNKNRKVFHHHHHGTKFRNSRFRLNNNYLKHRKTPPSPPAKQSSLKLISGYGSNQSDDDLDIDDDTNTNDVTIKSIINDLIVKVEKIQTNDNKRNNKQQRQKIKQKHQHHQQQLNYSNLNLFQKLMLQDVRNVKQQLLQSLQLLIETNFLQNRV